MSTPAAFGRRFTRSSTPGQVRADLGDDAVLLCWENSGAFCHWRLVAEWLEENLGVSVPEVGEVGGADDRGQTKLGEWILVPSSDIQK